MTKLTLMFQNEIATLKTIDDIIERCFYVSSYLHVLSNNSFLLRLWSRGY